MSTKVQKKNAPTKTKKKEQSDDVCIVDPPPIPFERPEKYVILCKVCMNNRIDTIFIPCRHACVCEQCYDKLPVPKECPICRRNVFRTIHVIIDS